MCIYLTTMVKSTIKICWLLHLFNQQIYLVFTVYLITECWDIAMKKQSPNSQVANILVTVPD